MTSSIPELLGFSPIPFGRDKAYSVNSYRAQYILTEEEAQAAIDTYQSHPAIDMHLAQRYIKDTEYRQRIEEARQDITATEPSQEVKLLMDRMQKKGEVA